MDNTFYQIGKDVGILQANVEVLANDLTKRISALEQHTSREIASDQEADNEALGRKLAELEELRKRVAAFEAKAEGG